MSFLNLEVLIPIWAISMTIGGWLAKLLDKAAAEEGAVPRGLSLAVGLAALWVGLLSVVIVYVLVRRAETEPVVGWVLVTTVGVIVLISIVWGLVRLGRRRREFERAYLAPKTTHDPPAR